MATQQSLLKIQEVSHRLSIPTHTLRFWERELDGIIVPFRTPGGQRLYSDEMVSMIGEINGMRKRGMSLAQIRADLADSETTQTKQLDGSEIEVLADRVARAVKSEVYRFFEKAANGVESGKLFEKRWSGLERE
jgi:DNA-binding transcriptional MerR regulator